MRIRENSHCGHQAARSGMAFVGRLGARVSMHLTAYASAGGFGWRLASKIIRPIATGLEFVLAVCSRLAARLLAVFAIWFGAVLFGAVSFGFVNLAHAEASMPLCEAAFSGSLPVLKELAGLKVAATQAQAAGNRDFAITLYQLYQKSSNQAKVDGVDLRGLKAMVNEVEAKENKKSLDEEARREKTRDLEEMQLIDGKHMILQPISPGKFMMGEVGVQIKTEITKSYEMAATQTTQVVWRKVVEQAKLKFPGKYDVLNPDPSKYKGELNPVEQVSWDDVKLWLSALNELAAQGDAIVNEVMPNHKPGEIYRLPTEAEWEFVVRARGEAQGNYHFGESETELKEHAWFDANAQNQPHPVAQKHPLVIDGRELYDLHGNVWEWTQDSWDGLSQLKGGVDPLGITGSFRVTRGGSWNYGAYTLRSGFRNYWAPDYRASGVGFRLVRALP
jgi:formylglycine-generating enzyme required for sulfatase activity